MANYNLAHIKGQTFHSAPIADLLSEAAEFVEALGENYTVTGLAIAYDEDFDPYLTLTFE